MFENSVYSVISPEGCSVISPEGCAAILWQAGAVAQAASALRLTAPDLLRLGIVDGIIPEPPGGAHTDPGAAAEVLGSVLRCALAELEGVPADQLVACRRQRLRRIGSSDSEGPARERPVVPR
jgi:acyl-CoA carboxylase subunit beta